MDQKDRIYFARRAAEEQELALAAADKSAEQVHRQMQRAYLERASVGNRPAATVDLVGKTLSKPRTFASAPTNG